MRIQLSLKEKEIHLFKKEIDTFVLIIYSFETNVSYSFYDHSILNEAANENPRDVLGNG